MGPWQALNFFQSNVFRSSFGEQLSSVRGQIRSAAQSSWVGAARVLYRCSRRHDPDAFLSECLPFFSSSAASVTCELVLQRSARSTAHAPGERDRGKADEQAGISTPVRISMMGRPAGPAHERRRQPLARFVGRASPRGRLETHVWLFSLRLQMSGRSCCAPPWLFSCSACSVRSSSLRS